MWVTDWTVRTMMITMTSDRRILGVVFAFFLTVCAVLPAACAECFSLDAGASKKIFYFSEHAVEAGDRKIEYAVVWIHGNRGGSQDPAVLLRRRLAALPDGRKVLCIAPAFNTTRALKNPAMKAAALLWDKENWRGGGASSNGEGISSFAVVDLLCRQLTDGKKYPRLRHILIAGFSAGGQFVDRYAAVGRPPEREGIRYAYAVGAPSSYLYIDERRFCRGRFQVPCKPGKNFNRWRKGLEDPPEYAKDISRDQILKNLSSRYTLYLCGARDTGGKDLDTSPAAMLQGENRYDRFTVFRQYTALFPAWRAQTCFVTVPGFGHDKDRVMFSSPEFLGLIFGKRPPRP